MNLLKNKSPNSRPFLSIELLKTLSEKELNNFELFISNGYFNSDKDLIVLLKILKRHALKAEKFTVDIQLKIFKKVFDETSVKQKELSKKDSSLLNKKLNKLRDLAEQFLMIELIKDNDYYRSELLYPKLIDRNQTLLFKRYLNKDKKTLGEELKKGLEYHKKQYLYQGNKLTYFYTNGLLHKEDSYNELLYHLDINYILEKLRYHLAMVTIKDGYQKKEYDFSSFYIIEKMVRLDQYKDNALIKLYLLNIELVERKEDIVYNKLENLLKTNRDIIPTNFLKPFYTNLANYCASQIRQGKLHYYEKVLELYKEMHHNNVLVSYDLIRPNLLKNIITVCCENKEFELANKWLKHYYNYVDENIRESVLAFNSAIIEFSKQNYADAQDLFIKVKKINHTHEVVLKVFTLKCFYETETEYNDAVKQSIDTTNLFFYRHEKMPSSERKAYLNFVSILLKLYKLKNIFCIGEKKSKIERDLPDIIQKLNAMKLIRYKGWLMEKIGEFKKYT